MDGESAAALFTQLNLFTTRGAKALESHAEQRRRYALIEGWFTLSLHTCPDFITLAAFAGEHELMLMVTRRFPWPWTVLTAKTGL